MPITRRRLIAASGAGLAAAGSTALSGCGGEPREERAPERDVELLQRALDAETTVSETYGVAEEQQLGEPLAGAVSQFGERNARHLAQLVRRIEEAGGTPADPDPSFPPAESAVEAVRAALGDSIAASQGIVADLSSPEARRTIYEMMIANAAQLAVMRGVLGEDQVPAAFVTGGPEPPLAAEPEGGGP